MICLDTNYLILGLVRGSAEADALLRWSDQGETFCVSTIVWYEFLCGPVTDVQVQAMRSLLAEIAPFDEGVADEAARLFNRIGRRRHLRVDAMIAAVAITRSSPFATRNTDDFNPFVEFGLSLCGEP